MDVKELAKEQIKLAKKVKIKDDFDEIKYIGGCDQAYVENKVISSIVVLEKDTFKVVEKKYAVEEAPIKYIPGYLSYRESPAVVAAFTKLDIKPDVLFVDGNGILHPRKIGIASHLGIILDVPTIGIAKKIIIGEEKDGKILVDGEKRATVVQLKEHARAVYVSSGHRISMRTAVDLVKKSSNPRHKLPEPLHEAHKFGNKVKKRIEKQC